MTWDTRGNRGSRIGNQGSRRQKRGSRAGIRRVIQIFDQAGRLAVDFLAEGVGFCEVFLGEVFKVQGDVGLALDFGGGAVGDMEEIGEGLSLRRA